VKTPILGHTRLLPPGPRSFLLFSACNLVSWQCIVGPSMILFARELHMPESWVGWLLAFLPLTNLLVVAMVPLVSRVGPKRLMLSTWGARNVAVASIFLMPLALQWGGERAGWYLLSSATLAFCVIRAVGSGGWLPWVHEIVPVEHRGPFFTAETAIAQTLNIAVILGQGLILRGDPGMPQFFLIYAIGVGAGFTSLLWMSRIPGGQGAAQTGAARQDFSVYKVALRDRRYIAFILFATVAYMAVTFYSAASVLFLREILQLRAQTIMIVLALGSVGIVASIHAWSRFTERSGSGVSMSAALLGFAAAAFAFLAIAPRGPWALPATRALVILASLLAAAYAAAANRAMLNFARAESCVGYTNLWSVGTSLALGVTPVAVGILIERHALTGFTTCFLAAGVLALLCAAASPLIVRDARHGGTTVRLLRLTPRDLRSR